MPPEPTYFRGEQTDEGLVIWTGDPDCDAAHQALVAWLSEICHSFLTSVTQVDNRLKGNLGEAITYYVAYAHRYSSNAVRSFPASDLMPLGRISKPGVDLVWIVFGERQEDDIAIFQEVKTTSESSLVLADKLIDDYNKLFGTDIQFTVHSRLQSIKNLLEYSHRRVDLVPRISHLAGQSPNTSPRLRLIPTLVHELGQCDPIAKMTAIRSILVGRGWTPDFVEGWAIGLSQLEDRLARLAMGIL